MKEKEGANIIGGGLRRETWIHPGDGRRVRRTTSAATANETRLSHTSDLEELSQLTSVEVFVYVVTLYLVFSQSVHKIFCRYTEIEKKMCLSYLRISDKVFSNSAISLIIIRYMHINCR